MKLARTSLVLMMVQLALVSSIAAKYLYQRWHCPRVWTRAVSYDPALIMRGRYLAMKLVVDGCGHMPPIGPLVSLSGYNGVKDDTMHVYLYSGSFHAKLGVENNRLIASWNDAEDSNLQSVVQDHRQGGACDALMLENPLDFYIPEHSVDPTAHLAGKELWVEVTVPPKGPPRPLQLALKENGVWKPMAFE